MLGYAQWCNAAANHGSCLQLLRRTMYFFGQCTFFKLKIAGFGDCYGELPGSTWTQAD
jgi:hypothetical protein